MVGPRLFLRALGARTGAASVGAVLGLSLGLPLAPALALSPASASAAPSADLSASLQPAAAVPAEPDAAPLRVRIATMSKAALPARGEIRITGTVTNRSEETWTTVNLYTFAGTELVPMTTPGDLEAAMDIAYDADVGRRQVSVGEEPGSIDVLEPGETAPYSLTVPVDALPFDAEPPESGVYWFGVHALGQGGSAPRDDVADGRARTFLPYVPRRTDPVPAALVVPLTQAVLYTAEGAVADEERWTERLSPGGRLRDLLALGQTGAATGVPITWLVDPALLDAIGRLAAGNPGRSLAPTPGRPGDDGGDPVPDDPEDGSASDDEDGSDTSDDAPPEDEPSADGESTEDAEPLADSPVAIAARGWLDAAEDVFAAGEVATLPYGNPDVAATQEYAPDLLDLALVQESSVLRSLDIDPRQVLAPPGGYVDADTAAAAPDDAPILVEDRFFTPPAPGVARLDGQQLVVTSAGARQGSPGPGRTVTAVGLRQRVLAEAAVRALPDLGEATSVSGQPLVVQLPISWDLSTAEEFFDGLDQRWIDFGPLQDAIDSVVAREVTVANLAEFTGRRRTLEPATFEAVEGLIEAGDTLQRILVSNTEVGARVTEQALSGLSYAVRRQQAEARSSLALSRSWIDARLASVQVTASSGVTLSGDSGSFLVTLENGLDEPVRVGIAAVSDDELEVDAVEPLELGADSRTTVLMNATTSTSRVHSVTLVVTDADGAPLGSTDQLPVRSVLVSDVIWLIIGVGVGTLFLAIALRLRRRILASRRGGPAPA